MTEQIVITGTSDTERIEAPVTVKAYFLCAFAAFGGILFGYDTGWVGGVMAMPYFIRLYTGKQYPSDVFGNDKSSDAYNTYLKDFHLTASDQSLITSILSAGTFVGALLAGDIADFFGRRVTIITGCCIFCIGCVLQTVSTTLPVMVVGRLIAGSGVGLVSATIIVYMSEIAPRKVRGALVSAYEGCITVGILLANCVVYSSQSRDDSGSYRIPIAMQFLWAVILAFGLFFLPESPRYFVRRGQLEKATAALTSIRGQPRASAFVQDELAEIVANYEYELQILPQTSYIGSWINCFEGSITNGASNLRRTILGTGMQMMQQFTGINFIFYFGTVFFTSLGTIKNPFLITLIISLINVCSTPIAFWVIERFGRRPMLIYGAAGMVATQLIVGIVGATAGKPGNQNDSATAAMIAFICLDIAFFAITWGPAAWVVIGEAFPLTIRSRGIALSTSSNWLWNCVIGIITPYLVGTGPGNANLGSNVFFMWGGLCGLSLAFAYFLVPETKGLSLEQIDKLVEETTPRTSSRWVPHMTFASEMHHTTSNTIVDNGDSDEKREGFSISNVV